MRVEMMARKEQRDEREQRNERQRAIVAAKAAPSRAGINPVDEFEKTINDDPLVANRKRFYHKPFGKLVEREHHQRERGDVPVRLLKNGFGGVHEHQS